MESNGLAQNNYSDIVRSKPQHHSSNRRVKTNTGPDRESHVEQELVRPGTFLRPKWKIVRRIGSGGFGAIYEGVNLITGKEVAVKIEPRDCPKQLLNMEVTVMKNLLGTSHCCEYFGCGRTPTYSFLVMTLQGNNLAQLRRELPRGIFSVSTTLRLTLQLIESIQTIHERGFLHRDIKPSNFAMGKSQEKDKTCYMLDFGLARQYVTSKGELRRPRSSAGFRGTVRYASINAHHSKELGRHDDLWSLFYMIVEFRLGYLPWRKIRSKDEVTEMKANYDHKQFLRYLPQEFEEFYQHLTTLTYYDRPNYELLKSLVQKAMARKDIKLTESFDWEVSSNTLTTKSMQMKDRSEHSFLCIKANNISKQNDGPSDHADRSRSRSCVSMAPANLQDLIKAKISNAYSHSILMKTSAACQSDVNSLIAHRTFSSVDSKSDTSLGNKDPDSITSKISALKIKSSKIDFGRDVLLKQLEKKMMEREVTHGNDNDPSVSEHDPDGNDLNPEEEEVNMPEINPALSPLGKINEPSSEDLENIREVNGLQGQKEIKKAAIKASKQDIQSNPGITIIVQRRISVDHNNAHDGNSHGSLLANFDALRDSMGISHRNRRSTNGDTLSTRKYRTVAVITPNDEHDEELEQSSEDQDNQDKDATDTYDQMDDINTQNRLNVISNQQDQMEDENRIYLERNVNYNLEIKKTPDQQDNINGVQELNSTTFGNGYGPYNKEGNCDLNDKENGIYDKNTDVHNGDIPIKVKSNLNQEQNVIKSDDTCHVKIDDLKNDAEIANSRNLNSNTDLNSKVNSMAHQQSDTDANLNQSCEYSLNIDEKLMNSTDDENARINKSKDPNSVSSLPSQDGKRKVNSTFNDGSGSGTRSKSDKHENMIDTILSNINKKLGSKISNSKGQQENKETVLCSSNLDVKDTTESNADDVLRAPKDNKIIENLNSSSKVNQLINKAIDEMVKRRNNYKIANSGYVKGNSKLNGISNDIGENGQLDDNGEESEKLAKMRNISDKTKNSNFSKIDCVIDINVESGIRETDNVENQEKSNDISVSNDSDKLCVENKSNDHGKTNNSFYSQITKTKNSSRSFSLDYTRAIAADFQQGEGENDPTTIDKDEVFKRSGSDGHLVNYDTEDSTTTTNGDDPFPIIRYKSKRLLSKSMSLPLHPPAGVAHQRCIKYRLRRFKPITAPNSNDVLFFQEDEEGSYSIEDD
ncbi:Tau-tubulin kinase 1 [Trichoplax sp. H2]|nr:Tau-tubulin kinase 1 [Trichoplax sp. H2]|eukprot:RDD40865.1 Tau-tubulin kinase 1 [Trichoplax sp. H2]